MSEQTPDYPDTQLLIDGVWRESADGRRIPVLTIEVVSEDSVDRDYRAKREEYLAYGLLEYWIIDLKLRKMTLLVRHGDAWLERPCLDDQPIPSLVLPGLTAKVADLWTDLDECEPDA